MNGVKRRPWLGLFLIATGRAAGFALFGDATENFLASLAPLLAGSLTLGGLLALSGDVHAGLGFILVTLCSLLTPPILAEFLCRKWQREREWALYANVLNWAQWLIILVMLAFGLSASLAVAAGLPPMTAVTLMVAGIFVYMLWFHWFTAHHALRLSRRRAALVMILVVFGTSLLLQLPVSLALMAGQTSPLSLPVLDQNGSGS